MASLEELCRMVRDSRGMIHIVRLGVLRDYLKTTTPYSFKTDIASINDVELLRALVEAGVRRELQRAFNARLRELTG